MKIAIHVAEGLVREVFEAIAVAPVVREALEKLSAIEGVGRLPRAAGHVLEAAGYTDSRDDELSFDGEFDFHLGPHGHRAVRVNVAGTMRRVGHEWNLTRASVESVDIVDGADRPDEVLPVAGTGSLRPAP